MKYRIRSEQIPALRGVEFEVDDNATEEEIAVAAAEAIAEWLDYGWEQVEEGRS